MIWLWFINGVFWGGLQGLMVQIFKELEAILTNPS